MVHVINSATSTRIKQSNTTERHVQYNLGEFDHSDCIDLSSIVITVSTVYSWSNEVTCESEESEAKRIPDLSYIECIHTGIRILIIH